MTDTTQHREQATIGDLDETHVDETYVEEEQVAVPMRKDVGIRRVRMTISRVDPLSALKLSFLVSVGIGIMIVVAAIILWFVMDAMHVWARIDDLLVTLNSEPLLELGQFMDFGRVVSFAVVVGVIEVVIFTLLGTVLALLYNVIAMLVGGLYITVTDE